MEFEFDNIRYWLSSKNDGAMNIRVSDFNENNYLNRKNYFAWLDINIENIVAVSLIHETNIATVNEKDWGQFLPNTDWLITNRKNLYLTVTVGDCVPIYFYDNKKSIIWLAHAGWRWVVKNISKSLIEKMISEFESKPEDISVFIGPHLSKCHFEVKEDVSSQFDNEFIVKNTDFISIDLLSVIKNQLSILGIGSKNISSSDECTFCNRDKFFSYRRDKPKKVQSMIAYIWLI